MSTVANDEILPKGKERESGGVLRGEKLVRREDCMRKKEERKEEDNNGMK